MREILLNVNPNGKVDVQSTVFTDLDRFTTFITTASCWAEVFHHVDLWPGQRVIVRAGESIRPWFMASWDAD